MTMFCNQCEETAQGIACTQRGVCGKTAATAQLQDEIIAALINLASFKPQTTQEEDDLITEGQMCIRDRYTVKFMPGKELKKSLLVNKDQ